MRDIIGTVYLKGTASRSGLCIALLVLFLSAFQCISAQTMKSAFKVDTATKFIETDLLKNLYIVTPLNVILKYDSTGKLLASQQFKNNGEITSIDVTNPLNTEIFYSGQNRITITDNMLNSIAEVSLENSPVQQYSVGCRAASGGFWLYDVQEAKIKRVDQQNQQQGVSQNIAGLGIRDLNPVFMTENSPWLYMCIPSNGIMIFDQYGAYFKNIPVKNISRFKVLKNTIVYYKDGVLNYWDIETNEQKTVTLPFITENTQDIKAAPHRYWMQTKKGVSCFVY